MCCYTITSWWNTTIIQIDYSWQCNDRKKSRWHFNRSVSFPEASLTIKIIYILACCQKKLLHAGFSLCAAKTKLLKMNFAFFSFHYRYTPQFFCIRTLYKNTFYNRTKPRVNWDYAVWWDIYFPFKASLVLTLHAIAVIVSYMSCFSISVLAKF